jgi:ubiquinone/menaquinone biosynthesis C-methylase UbiE
MMRPTMAGFYERRVFPWLNDQVSSTPEVLALRTEILRSARGTVFEIGFGSGANLAHYPASVESVVAIDPNPGMHERAAAPVKASRIPVTLLVGRAEALPLPDATVDTAVSTLTLCSVSDPARVLAELRRVLTDEGRLLVMEHGQSAEPGVARWQDRLNGIQNVVACGCNLNRPIQRTVEAAGFRFESIRMFYLDKTPRTHGCFTVGVAAKDRTTTSEA